MTIPQVYEEARKLGVDISIRFYANQDVVRFYVTNGGFRTSEVTQMCDIGDLSKDFNLEVWVSNTWNKLKDRV